VNREPFPSESSGFVIFALVRIRVKLPHRHRWHWRRYCADKECSARLGLSAENRRRCADEPRRSSATLPHPLRVRIFAPILLQLQARRDLRILVLRTPLRSGAGNVELALEEFLSSLRRSAPFHLDSPYPVSRTVSNRTGSRRIHAQQSLRSRISHSVTGLPLAPYSPWRASPRLDLAMDASISRTQSIWSG